MSRLTRRGLLGTTAVLGVGLVAAPHVLRAQTRPKVVVIGGGAGGATVAKYVARDSKGAIEVALVEPKETYTTCFYSNLYLAGWRSLESITHRYVNLVEKYGVIHYRDMAVDVDTGKKVVRLASGRELPYDKLVVAPGIDFRFDTIEGYDEAASMDMPHAYQAGEQTALLRTQLEAMEDGGTVVIAPPPNPYRCPPGPYERTSLIANYLKKTKPKSKILVCDSKDKFSKQALFQDAWQRYYDGMIEWIPGELGGRVVKVDTKAMTVTLEGGDVIKASVANIIPAQKAGWIAHRAGLANDSGWCPIDPDSMASTVAQDVYVLGDASIASKMPKSGFAANSQAKVVAMDIRHQLLGDKRFPARYRNTCWSSVADNDAVKVGASYKAGETQIEVVDKFISQVDEPPEVRAQTRAEADAWYDSITQDMFA